MKIMVCSTESSKDCSGRSKWIRTGNEIHYSQNSYEREVPDNPDLITYCYTLSFTYTFPHSNDCVYFAYSTPYSFSNLREDLNKIEGLKKRYFKRTTLCQTIGGNNCDLLSITSPTGEGKLGVIITGRVHPGEVVGSWMMKGVIDFLVGDSPQARKLRDLFVFKIVPMLNPDGVIVGNQRCSLLGSDLNRKYSYPSKVYIYYIYIYIRVNIQQYIISNKWLEAWGRNVP